MSTRITSTAVVASPIVLSRLRGMVIIVCASRLAPSADGMRCCPITVPLVAAFDASILRSVLELPHPGWLNSIMVAVSRVGTGGAIWLALAVVLALLRELTWRDFARLALALLIVYGVVDFVLKPWVDRARPAVISPVAAIDMPKTRSFPSGHAASATAAAFVITRMWKRTRALIWIAAMLVAFSRIYLGVHYPLDVLGGCVTGFVCGWIALRIPPVRLADASRRG